MRRLIALLLLIVPAASALAYQPDFRKAPQPNAVRVAVARFGGDAIGVNVATILNLQVFQTLRVASGAPSSRGEVVAFIPEKFQSNDLAVTGAQLALSGEAFRFANGTVVQAYLQIRRRKGELAFQDWTIQIPLDGQTHTFTADLPARDYDFAPVVLPNDVVERYSNIAALKICSDRDCRETAGSIGEREFRALSNDRETILIGLDKSIGYIRVPELAATRTNVVDFTSAVVRVLRRDWSGAIDYFDEVLKRDETPLGIRIDTHLLRAMCNAQLGKSWKSDLGQAVEANPYRPMTARYALMLNASDAAAAIKAGKGGAAEVEALRTAAAKWRSYFDENDPLLRAVDAFTNAYAAR